MLLITDGADGRTGVEVRNADVNLTHSHACRAIVPGQRLSWDARFDGVQDDLHLPPGHPLVRGVGRGRYTRCLGESSGVCSICSC
jgi:hypothetical protein